MAFILRGLWGSSAAPAPAAAASSNGEGRRRRVEREVVTPLLCGEDVNAADWLGDETLRTLSDNLDQRNDIRSVANAITKCVEQDDHGDPNGWRLYMCHDANRNTRSAIISIQFEVTATVSFSRMLHRLAELGPHTLRRTANVTISRSTDRRTGLPVMLITCLYDTSDKEPPLAETLYHDLKPYLGTSSGIALLESTRRVGFKRPRVHHSLAQTGDRDGGGGGAAAIPAEYEDESDMLD
jgi:hypothetical protein